MQKNIYSFSTPYLFYTDKLKRLLRCWLATLILGFFATTVVFAEGTKQLEPNGASGYLKIIFHQNAWTSNGWRINFALPNCDTSYRLHVHISDFTTEKILFGFNDFAATGIPTPQSQNIYYQLRKPDGVLTNPGTPVYPTYQKIATSGVGFISSKTDCYNGPITGGYSPITYTPDMNGDYYFEFASDAAGNSSTFDGVEMKFFDISVVKNATQIIDGRVWSRTWQFSDGNSNSPSTVFYMYSDDKVVTKLDINGWDGGTWMFYCNAFGYKKPSGTATWQDSTRNSQNDISQFTWPGTAPQYMIFLNDPEHDIANPTYPTGVYGQICPPLDSDSHCDGTVDIKIKMSAPGKISLLVDVDPQNPPPLPPGPEDVTLTADVTPTDACNTWQIIPWNGLDGFGNPVVNGATINTNVTYLRGLTNLPIYDIESNLNGIKVDFVRPIPPSGSTHCKIYWNDQNLSPHIANGIRSNLTGCEYPGTSVNPNYPAITGCHNWLKTSGNNYNGNLDIINSWWYYETNESFSLAITTKHSPDTPGTPSCALSPGTNPVNICQGSSNVTFSIPMVPSADSVVWMLPNGDSIITLNQAVTNTVNLNFPNMTSGGVLKVHGKNATCPQGLNSPELVIVMTADVLPTITGNQAVCNGTTHSYTCPSPVSNYTWSPPAGGSILSGGGTATIVVQWNTVGNHTIDLETSSVTCGLRTASLPVVVNALPIPTIVGPNSVCLNSTGNIYTTEAGMTGYVWTISAGGAITAGAGTNAITVTWNTAGPQTVSVDYTNVDACTALLATDYQVTVNPLPTPTITGPVAACLNTANSIYTTEAGMTNYTWNIPSGGTITAGAGTNAVTVTWNAVGPQT
ncbi:MAG: hypothetical protein WCR72_02620, partial [Bacteroidota bacterium]